MSEKLGSEVELRSTSQFGKKSKLKFAVIGVTLFLCAAGLTGCTTYDNFVESFFGGSHDGDTVKIALYEPISGEYSQAASAEIEGVELAHQLFPQVLGKDVELVYADNGSDLNAAKTTIENLVQQKPAIVLGSYGNAFSMLAGETFQKEKIPAITITNTNPLVNASNPYYFRVCFVEAYQGKALATYTVKGLKAKKAAVLLPQDDDYAMALGTTYSNKMVSLTGDENAIAISQNYMAGDLDFTTQLKKIKESGIKVVFLPGGVKDALRIIEQAKEMNLKLTFLGTESWAVDEFMQTAITNGWNNVFFPTAYDSSNLKTEMADVFLKAYQKDHGENQPPEAAALGFDAYLLAIDAITNAKTTEDGTLIAKALSDEQDFQGASGVIRFDDQGNPERAVIVNGIIGGQVTPVYTVEPTVKTTSKK